MKAKMKNTLAIQPGRLFLSKKKKDCTPSLIIKTRFNFKFTGNQSHTG
jgi:hypothetical protein